MSLLFNEPQLIVPHGSICEGMTRTTQPLHLQWERVIAMMSFNAIAQGIASITPIRS